MDKLGLHNAEDCDYEYELCGDNCRAMPKDAKIKRKLCWAKCASLYAACLATTDKAVKTCCLAGAGALITVSTLCPLDGPIGECAAASLYCGILAWQGGMHYVL